MTTSNHDTPHGDDASNDPQHGDEAAKPVEDADENRPSDDSTVPESDNAGEANSENRDDDEEELPEREPLTPELVEDEAIRGDFMIRWAIVLVAFLLALTKITETQTLVHIKTGQHILSESSIPATDVFSYTADDRSWINLSWLFDVLLAGLYAVSETGIALTAFKAILMTVTFALVVHTSRWGISTWWGSILAALALLASYPQFTAQPEAVTLFGLAVVMWLLNRWEEKATKAIWLLPVLFLFWTNADKRMFVGLAVLVLYALGRSVGGMLGRPRSEKAPPSGPLWGVVAASAVAALVNPFGWRSLAAPLALYGTEYPAGAAAGQFEFLPMFSMTFWNGVNHHIFAGLLVLIAAIVAVALNRKSLHLSHVFVLVALVGFAVAANHELAPVAIVACAIATLNFQEWYRDNYRQTYSVAASELVLTRGGRAATVLALFGLAFLAINGRLGGDSPWRLGVGFHRSLTAVADGLRKDVENSFDDRPFNFNFSQGDLLIWVGQRVFIDNRLGLYAGKGDENLIALHNRVRHAIRSKNEQQELSGRPEVWKAAFDQYGVTHVLPRLGGETSPDYVTHFDLLNSPDQWKLAKLGAATAAFYRRDLDDPELKAYLDEHEVDFVEQAFEEQGEPLEERPGWAQSPTFYQKYLTPPETGDPNEIVQARHYSTQLSQIYEGQGQNIARLNEQIKAEGGDGAAAALRDTYVLPTDLTAALAYLAIRNANQGLAEDPQSSMGYRVLGGAYEFLGFLESQVAAAYGGISPHKRRLAQTVAAYSQAVKIDPNDPALRLKLIELFYGNQKLDLALEQIREYERLTRSTSLTSAQIRLRQRNDTYEQQLSQSVERVANEIDRALSQNVDRYTIAVGAYQQGCVLHALQVLEQDPLLISQQPGPQQLHAVLLMEAGRVEEAYEAFLQFEGVARQYNLPNWREPAALSSLASAHYNRATLLWQEQADWYKSTAMTKALRTLPMVGPPMAWSVQQANSVMEGLYRTPTLTAQAIFDVALCHLETGQVEEATDAFRRSLDIAPDSPHRPLARFYLSLLTGETIDLAPPSQWIPISPDIFAADTQDQTGADNPAEESPDETTQPANADDNTPDQPRSASDTPNEPEPSTPQDDRPSEPDTTPGDQPEDANTNPEPGDSSGV